MDQVDSGNGMAHQFVELGSNEPQTTMSQFKSL